MKANDILYKWGEFFEKRNKDYGDAYLRHGELMEILFPNGITLEEADDFYYYHIFVLEVVKLTRIANAMSRGEHHGDSWMDLAVYAAMYMEKLKKEES